MPEKILVAQNEIDCICSDLMTKLELSAEEIRIALYLSLSTIDKMILTKSAYRAIQKPVVKTECHKANISDLVKNDEVEKED